MRAAVYTRISLDRSGEGAGVERQQEDCLRLISQREWSVAGEPYSDNSISAAGKKTRPRFDAMLTAIERREFDVIVSWAWDRLSRNRRDEVRLIEACKTHGVSVALVRGAGDLDMSSAVGRGIGEILATLGRMENEQKSERQRRALAQRSVKGLPWGPIPAFGYADDRVTIVEHEAEHIRAAYRAVLAGASCRGIAAEWNAAKIRTRTHLPKPGKVNLRKGKKWSGAAIRRLLINPRYMGVRGSSVGTGGRRELREVGPAAWQPIVAEETWRSVHALLTDDARRTTSTRVRVHLLPGIARCGRCGAPMRSHTTQRGYPAYTCSAARHLSRKTEPVDALVRAVVVERLSRPDARELLVDGARSDAAPLRDEALALRGRLDALAVEFADGELTASQLRVATERLRNRLGEIEAQMSTTSRAPVLAELVGLPDVAERFDALPLDRRRAVVSALMQVTVLPARQGPGFDPATVDITWKST